MSKSLMLSVASVALKTVYENINNPNVLDKSTTVTANKNDPNEFGTFFQEVTVLDKKFFVMVTGVDKQPTATSAQFDGYLFEKDENLGA